MSDSTSLTVRPHMSPPRIVHLLAWMFFAAMNFTAQRWFHHSLAEAGIAAQTVFKAQVAGVFFSMISGGAMTGLLVLATQLARGNPSVLRQPGHWIAAILAISSLLNIARLLVVAVIGRRSESFFLVWFVPSILISVVHGVLFFLAIKRGVRSPRWRFLFIGAAVMSFGQAALYTAFTLGVHVSHRQFQAAIFLELPIAVGFFVVSLWEWSLGGRRDWIHWLGVTVYAAQALVAALQEIAFTYL